MKRVALPLAVMCTTILLGACGAGEIVVQAELPADSATGEATPLSDIIVRLVPYDRDAIFDSLAAAYPEPEPPIPDSLLALQESISQANAEWQEIEAAWNVARDSLRELGAIMDTMDRAAAEYYVLFTEFNELDSQVRELSASNDAAFQNYLELQDQFATESQETAALRSQWADRAFEPVDSIIFAQLDALDLEVHEDTTDATGIVRFQDVPPGEWWVYARYELLYDELYWNEPIRVEGGEPIQIQLTPENAEERPVL